MNLGDLSRINTNVQSMQALGQLNKTNAELGVRQLRLSTGSRLNRAEDDSAGYSIAKKLQAKTRGQAQALSNIGDAKGMLTVGEGALNSTMDILQTMKEKAVQAANDTMGTEERTAIQNQLNELSKEVSDVLGSAEFNGTKLFTDATEGKDFSFQVGATSSDDFGVNVSRMSRNSLVGEGSNVVAPSSTWAGGDIAVTNYEGDGAQDYVYTANTLTADITAGGTDSAELDLAAAAIDTSAANAFNVGQNVEFRTQGDVASMTVEYKDADGEWQEAASGLDMSSTTGGNQTVTVNGLSFDLIQSASAAEDTTYGEGLSFTVQAGTLTDAGGAEADYDASTGMYTSDDGNLSFSADTASAADTNTFTIQADKGLYVSSNESAQHTLDTIDAAISSVSESLSGLGDAQSRLTIKQDNLDTSMTNYEAARSRIEDTDFAKEQMEIVKLQILQQTGIGSLAQANSGPQGVLSLIG